MRKAEPRVVTVSGTTFKVDRKYTDLKAIGRGSYGVVCSCTDTTRKSKVAIKRIRPMAAHTADAKHVLREVRLMRLLGAHENVISMFDLFCSERDDELYIVMELLDSDLHRIIQSPQPLTDAHHRYFMYQLVRGVSYLHEHNVIHRDLKPGNLLVTRNCELRITDFGLARERPRADSDGKNADGGDLEGAEGELHPMTQHVVTRWYRPPELMLTPDGLYTDAVDMWSVGCILGELLGRQPLFPGKNFVHQLQLIFAVIGAPPDAETRLIRNRQARKFLDSIRTKPKVPFTKVYPSAPSAAHELLESLLSFAPSARLSAATCLKQRYFANLSYARDAPPDPPVARDCDFSFEHGNHSRAALRRMIVEEVDAFHKTATRTQQSKAPSTASLATARSAASDASASKRPASASRQRPEQQETTAVAHGASKGPKRPGAIGGASDDRQPSAAAANAVPIKDKSSSGGVVQVPMSPTKRAAAAAADRKEREQKRIASPQSPLRGGAGVGDGAAMAAAAVAPGSPAQRAAVAAAERRRQGFGAAAEEPHARAASFGAHGTDRDNEQRFGGGVRMADYAASEAAAAAAAALDMARGGAVSGAATAYGARPAWTSSASAAGSGSGSMQDGGAAVASASAYRPSSRVVNDRGGIGAARGATATVHDDEISGAGSDGISPPPFSGHGSGGARAVGAAGGGGGATELDHQIESLRAANAALRNRTQSVMDSVTQGGSGGGPVGSSASTSAIGTGAPLAAAADERSYPFNGPSHDSAGQGAGRSASASRPTSGASTNRLKDAELARAYGKSGGAAVPSSGVGGAATGSGGGAVPRARSASASRAGGRPPSRAPIPDESSQMSFLSGSSGASALAGAARVGAAPPRAYPADSSTGGAGRYAARDGSTGRPRPGVHNNTPEPQPQMRKGSAKTQSQKKLTVPKSPQFSKMSFERQQQQQRPAARATDERGVPLRRAASRA